VTGASRRYRGNTLILETEFETAEGAVRLIDFMPLRDGARTSSDRRRRVGAVPMKMELVVRFDYGRTFPGSSRPDNGLRAISGPHSLVLRSPVETTGGT
jgi:hypothetical protein